MATQSWTWRFEAPPEKVWPAIADTARFNEAGGTPKYRVDADLRPDGTVIYTGRAKVGPFDLSWRDRPQEWVTNQQFRHQRDFHNGPFRVMTATMRLSPEGAATHGDFSLEMQPRNLLGRLL